MACQKNLEFDNGYGCAAEPKLEVTLSFNPQCDSTAIVTESDCPIVVAT